MTGRISFITACASLLLCAGVSLADTVIDFETDPGNGLTVENGYGAIPNMTTEYGTVTTIAGSDTPSPAHLAWFQAGAQNYGTPDTDTAAYGQVDLIVQAINQYSLTLTSFAIKHPTGYDALAEPVQVYDLNGMVPKLTLLQVAQTGTPGWTSPQTFTVGATSDLGFRIVFGNDLNVGVDDITFSVNQIPDPPSAVPLPLAGWGGLALFGIVGGLKARKKAPPAPAAAPAS